MSISSVDLRHKFVILDRQAIVLTRQEYRLLAALVQHIGEVLPRKILLTEIGYGPQAHTRAVDLYIGQLRKKLGHEGRRIETVVGKGYSFRPSLPKD